MTLLPAQSDAELLRLAEERQAKRRGIRLITEPPPAVLVLPVTIALPWSCLVSDNARTTIGNGSREPRIVLEPRYREAKRKIATIARAIVGDVRPVSFPLSLHARVFVPDDRPHDVCNFAKLVHDALQSVVYTVDRWLYDTRWTRAGVDCDAPRAEITILDLGLR